MGKQTNIGRDKRTGGGPKARTEGERAAAAEAAAAEGQEGPLLLTPEDIGMSSKDTGVAFRKASRFARGTDHNSKNKGTHQKLKMIMQRNEALWNDSARGDVVAIKAGLEVYKVSPVRRSTQ